MNPDAAGIAIGGSTNDGAGGAGDGTIDVPGIIARLESGALYED